MTLSEILRYPVKGFSPESIETIDLVPESGIPFDRHYAITHGASHFDHTNPIWIGRRNFLVRAHSPLLGSLSTTYDPVKGTISFRYGNRELLMVDVDDPAMDENLTSFLNRYASDRQPSPYRLVWLDKGSLTDSPTQTVSIMNSQSLLDLQNQTGWSIEKARFRGNIWIDDALPWQERQWVGMILRIGEVELEVTEEIVRCAAIDVNPEAGVSDLSLLASLQKNFNHVNFGVLARVIRGGVLFSGADISLRPSLADD